MKTIFIKEMDRKRKIVEKIINKLKYIFNKIDIIEEKNNKIYVLPIYANKKLKKYKIKNIAKKIVKKLEQEGTNKVILSESLKSIVLLKNCLYSENINILNGRYLFKCLPIEIIEYILKFKNEKIENSEIWIMVNDLTNLNKQIIIEIAKNVKTLNIITNNINKCKRIEKYLYNEYGILLNITNNKKTSLLKAKIIFNVDFPEELVNKYKINTKAIIINMLEKIEIQSKKFNGININYFKIKIPAEFKIEGFSDEEIYEGIIHNYSFEEMHKRIKREEIKIEGLIGNRGVIQEQEFRNY